MVQGAQVRLRAGSETDETTNTADKQTGIHEADVVGPKCIQC
jgi:hypothetical protein